MESTQDYLTRKHQDILDHGYDGQHSGVIALKVAERLISEGERPEISLVYEERLNPGSATEVVQFTPNILGEDTSWLTHTVCTTQTHAYDPLIGEPIAIEDYTGFLFDEEIKMKVETPSNQVPSRIEQILR
jgi:hypothetical protein